MKRYLALFLALILTLTCAPAVSLGDVVLPGELPEARNGVSYADLGAVTQIPGAAITPNLFDYQSAENATENGGAIELENGYVTYTVDIPEDGRYCALISYAAIPGSAADIELCFEIDSAVQFREASVCRFERQWRYAELARSYDNKGNMLRPSSEENICWRDAYFSDKEGYYTEPFAFYFSKGAHTFTIRSVREGIAIRSISLTPPPVQKPYAEVSKTYGTQRGEKSVTTAAIDASRRNSPSILPNSDLTNPYLAPFSLKNISYNTIGGAMWNMPGQTIAWEVDAPADGLYDLSFVYKQDAVAGLPVSRSLTLDGQIPFAEANAVVFPYSGNWERVIVGADNQPAPIWLTKGAHEIALTVTLGEVADICRRVSEISSELSAICTRIVMITGANPDNMRDYRLDERLPDIIPRFSELAAALDDISDDITALGGGRNDALTVSIMASQLHDFVKKPDSVPGRMDRFKDNIVNLAVWVLIASEMPLTLYSVTIAPADYEYEPVRPGFFGSLWFSVQRFFASFTVRAELTGNRYDENDDKLIEVWGQYGKDASEIFKRLCDEEFTAKTGIKVNYNIINSENLMFFNIAAKTGPDVCLNIDRGYPLDFGLRDSAVDISKLDGFAEFEKQFSNLAMLPNSYDGKVYGFPVTQTLPVMYVRTDIFADLGLKIPQTWEDFYAVISELGIHNLQVSPSGDLLSMFLLQNGGAYFNEELTECVLDSGIGIAALTEWTDLFVLRGAPVVSDFFNRFRTGEMPIGIADNSLYQMLDFAALEIKDAWAMYPVPGVLREDGTIDRTVVSNGTAGFVTNSRPERADMSWEFTKWFMSEAVQSKFALELEAMFGPSMRYFTATVNAQDSLAWDRHSMDVIHETLMNVTQIPGVPGAYFIGRHINNAFNEVVLGGESPRAAMLKYVEVINAEIARKRAELGLTD